MGKARKIDFVQSLAKLQDVKHNLTMLDSSFFKNAKEAAIYYINGEF